MKIVYLSNSIGKKSNGGSSLSGLRFLELLESKFGSVTLVTDEWRSPPRSTESRTIMLARVDVVMHGSSIKQFAKLVLLKAVNCFRRKTIAIDAGSEDVLLVANSFTTLIDKVHVQTSGRTVKVCVVRGDTTSFLYQGWSDTDNGDPLSLPRSFLMRLDGIIYVSKTIQQNWLAAGVDRCSWYLPNAIDEKEVKRVKQTSSEKIRSMIGFSSDKFHVVVVGSLQDRKGQDVFEKIFPQLFDEIPNIEIHFVGVVSAPFGGDKIADKLKATGREKIVIHGHKDNALEYVHAADIVVSVSRSEAFPRTVAEYLAMGKPIVSTRVAGADEMIDHQRNGILIDIDDESSLLSAIVFLARNEGARKRYAQEAEIKYLNNYSESRQGAQFSEIFEEVVRL